MKKIIFAVLLVLVVFGVLAGIKVLQIRKLITTKFTLPPVAVSAAVAEEQEWPDTLAAVGSITAVQGVTITPELAGKVTEIHFESGAFVAAGALLVKLDTSSEEAQLRATEAQAELARLNAERARKLRAENAIAQSELDAAEASVKQLEATADTFRAAIAKKTIRAPFAGQLGLRLVNLGENLDLGKPIVSLQSLAPVFGEFSLPQQELARVQTGLAVRAVTDTYPDQEFTGTLTAINPDLDAASRTLRLQATFANAEQRLRPGMFARLEVIFPTQKKTLVIPGTAILSAPFGDSVYVIANSTNAPGALVVSQRFIRTGRVRGDFVAVETGLQPGERVVSAGVIKLHNGSAVKENNQLAPAAVTQPKPPNS